MVEQRNRGLRRDLIEHGAECGRTMDRSRIVANRSQRPPAGPSGRAAERRTLDRR